MRTITGVFRSVESAAVAVRRLRELVEGAAISVLTPGSTTEEIESVPVTDDMPPVGRAMGGILGAALGVATGTTLALLPGLGPVVAVGMLGAAVLGVLGGAAGSKVGDTLDRKLTEGLPADELFVYEDALRKGRSVVIVLVEGDDREHEERVRQLLARAGAEDVDAARRQWWLGIRGAEEAAYEPPQEFAAHESSYRKGFEAALLPALDGRDFEEARAELERRFPDTVNEPAFRRGFERGQLHARRLRQGGPGAEGGGA